MKFSTGQVRLSASDLSNHLACRHLTTLDLQVAQGLGTEPDWAAPDLKVIQELGLRHEAAYLAHLSKEGLTVENLGHIDHKQEARLLAETLALMDRGADVIAQGALRDGEWFGRPDVLRRVEKPGAKWAWSYEVAEGDDDSAVVAVLGASGKDSGNAAGVFVGGAAGGGICGSEIPRE